MTTLFFDTLEFAKRLTGGGFNQQQAETLAAGLKEGVCILGKPIAISSGGRDYLPKPALEKSQRQPTWQ